MGQPGNLCHVDCSNRGLCDHYSGLCACFAGWKGPNCGWRENYRPPSCKRRLLTADESNVTVCIY